MESDEPLLVFYLVVAFEIWDNCYFFFANGNIDIPVYHRELVSGSCIQYTKMQKGGKVVVRDGVLLNRDDLRKCYTSTAKPEQKMAYSIALFILGSRI